MSLITKKALGMSLKHLMEKRDFDSISVTEITEHCGLNRKSFYYHFEDKFALLEWVFRSELEAALEPEAHQDFWLLLEHMLCYLDENRQAYRRAVGPRGEGPLRDILARELQRHLLASLERSGGETCWQKEAQAQFLADAFAVSMGKWLDAPSAITPAQYVSIYRIRT